MSLQQRRQEMIAIRDAAAELIAIYDKALNSPPPPHTDYWHQSFYDCEVRLATAISQCLVLRPKHEFEELTVDEMRARDRLV